MIPLSKPIVGDQELKNVVEVLNSGMLASGEWVKRFEAEFASYVGVNHAVTTTSGTVALDLALKALDITTGDEVLVFRSTSDARIDEAMCTAHLSPFSSRKRKISCSRSS